MRTEESITWILISSMLPDSDKLVWLFDSQASEPVWPGYLDGSIWRYADGVLANPTHWAEFPLGPTTAPVDPVERLKETVLPLRNAELSGRWHHGHGILCCGTLRIMRADFDTNPSTAFQGTLFNQVCGTLNAVNEFLGPTPDPFAHERIG